MSAVTVQIIAEKAVAAAREGDAPRRLADTPTEASIKGRGQGSGLYLARLGSSGIDAWSVGE